jgi:hypothetical protein
MPPKKNVEQEEAFEGQRLEQDSEIETPDTSGKCPSCGRDKINS